MPDRATAGRQHGTRIRGTKQAEAVASVLDRLPGYCSAQQIHAERADRGGERGGGLGKCGHSTPGLSNVVKVAAGGDGPVTDQRPRSVTTPLATYRVQFGPRFTFNDAAKIVGYLSRLGVSHLYCSPFLQA